MVRRQFPVLPASLNDDLTLFHNSHTITLPSMKSGSQDLNSPLVCLSIFCISKKENRSPFHSYLRSLWEY